MGYRNHITNLEKCHIFATLNQKIVFEKIQTASSLIMKLVHLCHTLFVFYKKTYNIYMLNDECF